MPKTELQKAVYAAFDDMPEKTDLEIAAHVFEVLHTGEGKAYEGKNPTQQYVARLRKRHARDTAPAVIEVEMPADFFEVPELDEPEEPDDPFEDFNIDEPIEPKPAPAFETGFELSNEQIGKIISLPFNKLAKYTGFKGWAIDPTDTDDAEFLELAAIVSKKHAPAILMNYGLEVMFAVALAGFMGDRLYGYKQYRADQNKDTTPTLIQQDNDTDNLDGHAAETTEPEQEPEPLHRDQTQGAAGVNDFLKRQRQQR